MSRPRNVAYLQLKDGLSGGKTIGCTYIDPKSHKYFSLLKTGVVYPGDIPADMVQQVEKVQLNGRQSILLDLDDPVAKNKIEKFYKLFPCVRIVDMEDENPNYRQDAWQLDLILPKEKAKTDIMNNKTATQLTLIIHNLDNTGRYNLAHVIGLPVSELSHEEIYEALLSHASSYKEGVINLGSQLLDILVDYPNIEYKVVMAKARHFNVVKEEGGVFKFQGSTLGATDEQIKNHFQHNPEQYLAMKRMVVTKDNLSIEEQETMLEESEKLLRMSEDTIGLVPIDENLIPKKKEKIQVETPVEKKGKKQ